MAPESQQPSTLTSHPSMGRPIRESDGPLPTLRGRYEILAELGRGSGGVVYRAFDQLRRVPVALKSLWGDGASEDWLRDQGHHVFGVLARVQHPALPSVLDWGFDPDTGRVYYTRVFVEGDPGSAQVGRLEPRNVAQLGVLLTEALGLLHQLGYCHGDLKPGNVLVDGSDPARLRACLIDFGLLFRSGTQEGGARGTYPYIAPELVQGAEPSAASDLYALGATLYCMLYGVEPRDARDVAPHELRANTAVFAQEPAGWVQPDDEANAQAYCALRDVLASLLHTAPERRALERASALLKPWAHQASDEDEGGARVFIGRERELAQAHRWALDVGVTHDARVLWIHGVEGVGKRTFASVLSERVRVDRPDLIALHYEGIPASANDVIEELVRQALLACPERFADSAEALLELFGDNSDWDNPMARRARLRRNGLRLIKVARVVPLWIVLDAVNETAAAPVLEALAQLIPQEHNAPLEMSLVVCSVVGLPTSGDKEATQTPLPPCQALELKALARAEAEAVLHHSLPEAREFVAELVSDAPESRLPARLHSVAQTIRSALQQGASPSRASVLALDAESADGLALEVFDRMAALEQRALCALAIATVAMTAQELREVLRLPETMRLDWQRLLSSPWARSARIASNQAPRYVFALNASQAEAALTRQEQVEPGLTDGLTQRVFAVLRRKPRMTLDAAGRVVLTKLAAAVGDWSWLSEQCHGWVKAWIGRNELGCVREVLGVLDTAAHTPGWGSAFALARVEAHWGIQNLPGVEDAARDAFALWSASPNWPESLRTAFLSEDPAQAPEDMDWALALREFGALMRSEDTQASRVALPQHQLEVLLLMVRANDLRNKHQLAAWRVWALLPWFNRDADEHFVLTFCRAVFDAVFSVIDAEDVSFVGALEAFLHRTRKREGFDAFFECRVFYLCGIFYHYKGRFGHAARYYERAHALSWEDETRCGLIRLKVIFNLSAVLGVENRDLIKHYVQRGLVASKGYGSDEMLNSFEVRTITLLVYQCRFFEAYETASRTFKKSQHDPFRSDLSHATGNFALALGALGLDDQLLKLQRFILGEARYIQIHAGMPWISAALRVGLVEETLEMIELISSHTPNSPEHMTRRLLPMYWMWAYVLLEDWDKAALYQTRTERIVSLEDSGGWTRSSALMVLVRYWIAKDNLAEAERCQDLLERICEEHNNAFLRPYVLHRRSELAWACNRRSEARQAVEEAAKIVRRWADRLPQAWAERFLKSRRQVEILRDARAWGEEGQRSHLLEQTREIMAIAQRLMRSSALGASSVFQAALEHAVRFVGAERAVLYHAERFETDGPLPPQALEGGEPTVVSLDNQGMSVQRWRLTPIQALGFGDALPKAPSTTVMRNLLSSRTPVFSDDAPRDRRLSHSRSIIKTDVRSILALPLRDGDAIRGVVYLDSKQGQQFTHTDQELMSLLGDQLGPVLHSVQVRDSIQGKRERFPRILGTSPAIQRLLDVADKAARSELSVLILGPTGTGKSLLARSIHDASARRSKPFIKVDFGEVSEELFAAELFGAERGAYTGAVRRRGLVEEAQGGTLFLDEIGELSLRLQSKLLTLLQDRTVRRVGQNTSREVDVRIIAATNKPLPELVDAGDFREDLFYRLNGLQITMPSLADRREDIPSLVLSHFYRVLERQGLDLPQPSPELLKALQEQPWQGNIRELFLAVERAIALAEPGLPLVVEDFSVSAGRQGEAPPFGAPHGRAGMPPGHHAPMGAPGHAWGAQPGYPGAPPQWGSMPQAPSPYPAPGQAWASPAPRSPWWAMPLASPWANPGQPAGWPSHQPSHQPSHPWPAYGPPPAQGWYGPPQHALPQHPYAQPAPVPYPQQPPASAWHDPSALQASVSAPTPPNNPPTPQPAPSGDVAGAAPAAASPPWSGARARGMDDALHATRLWMVKQALAATNGNKAEAARRLGISRRTLYNILEADGTQGA